MRKNSNYTNKGYYYIKAKNKYISSIVGTDIKLNIIQKIKILFSKGISISLSGIELDEEVK